MTNDTLRPPKDEGDWTLLQSRIDRSLWQWDRRRAPGEPLISRFVILRASDRLDYDTYDEAESMFEAMEE